MLQKYIFRDGKILEADLLTWGEWYEDPANRVIERTDLGPGLYVSTVFHGVDAPREGMAPLFFETMIFGGDRDLERHHTRTLGEAKQTHFRLVDELKGAKA